MEKKVLIVIHNLGIGGGAERIAAGVASGLKEKGNNVTLLTFYDIKDKYEYTGKTICLHEKEYLNPISKIYKLIRRAKIIKKICKENEIDTVISFMETANFPVILSKILFKNKSKIVVSIRVNPLAKNKDYRYFIKKLYPKSDLVVTLSRGVEYILNVKFNIKNTKTIYNLQNVEKFVDQGRKKIVEKKHLNIYDDSFVFITVGRLTEQKAQWNLIRAFKKVSLECKKARLIILGSGPLKSKLKELVIKLDLQNKVFLLGVVDNVFPYLKKANCFVLTSNYEGFGNVLTEALSQNLPVISTDCVAGPREILCPELEIDQKITYPHFGKYGVLVKPIQDDNIFYSIKEKPLTDEEEKLSNLMIEFLKDEKIQEKYKNGLERSKDFDKNKIIDEWISVI